MEKSKVKPEDWEDIWEDMEMNYLFFRERKEKPGPSVGRSLYEMGNGFLEEKEAALLAYLKAYSLLSNDKEADEAELKGTEKIIFDIWNELKKTNPTAFSTIGKQARTQLKKELPGEKWEHLLNELNTNT